MGVRILTWLLAFVFIGAGLPKLIGIEHVVEEFTRYGYPSWFRVLIGLAEVAGGVGLLIPNLARAATVGMLAIMAGAAWTMWSMGEAPLPPLVVGSMLAARLGLTPSEPR